MTGLNYVFGKRLLMPLMGASAFGDNVADREICAQLLRMAFVLGVLVMIVVWTRDNLPSRVDLQWLRAGGGLFSKGGHISAGRFNAGQKMLFWAVTLATLVIFASGLMLLFPLSFTDVNGMQLWGAVHTIASALFIAMIIGHIYIGTAGTEGRSPAWEQAKLNSPGRATTMTSGRSSGARGGNFRAGISPAANGANARLMRRT